MLTTLDQMLQLSNASGSVIFLFFFGDFCGSVKLTRLRSYDVAHFSNKKPMSSVTSV